jgi:hypothetical protein
LGRAPSTDFSFVAHHMLFDRTLLGGLLREIARVNGRPWHEAFVNCLDPRQASSISEWDTYGWWVMETCPEAARNRQLAWRDSSIVPGIAGRALMRADYDFIAVHAWARKSRLRHHAESLGRIGVETWETVRAR